MNSNLAYAQVTNKSNNVVQFPETAIYRPTYTYTKEEVKEQSSEPIRNIQDISRMQNYLLNETGRYGRRNYVIFTLGINLALRGGDLLEMRVCDFFTEDGEFRFNRKYRESKTGKIRRLIYNDVVVNLMTAWIKEQHLGYNDLLFKGQKPWYDDNGYVHYSISRNSYGIILSNAAKALGLTERVCTHTMRKTFCYHRYVNAPDESKAFVLTKIQETLGHSSQTITLRYLGFSDKDEEELYINTPLGDILI